MKIAYIILAHRYPEQAIRLVNRLNTASATFLIHVDKKSPKSIHQCLADELGSKSNVHFIKRYTCYWAGFGIVQATFQGIKEAIEKGVDFDYIALMSGQDYPIKTNEAISHFLHKHEGKSFIHFNPFPYDEWRDQNGGWDRVNYWHIVRNRDHYVVPCLKRKFPSNFHPYGGAQFWCLHKRHALYVYQLIINNPGYFRFFRHVFVPDEILFQTIMGNSKLTNETINDTLHYLEWYRPGAILYQSDLDNIRKTPHLFARKFDHTVDHQIIDSIDKEILFEDLITD